MNMDDKQKQIEEMVEIMCDDFGASFFAEKLYDAGYRKASDTAREILDEVSQHFGGAWLVKLYKKYGVEIEE